MGNGSGNVCKGLAVALEILGVIGSIVVAFSSGEGFDLVTFLTYVFAISVCSVFLYAIGEIVLELKEMNGYVHEIWGKVIKSERQTIISQTKEQPAASSYAAGIAKKVATWTCKKCGRVNDSKDMSCKDCGTYK